MNEIIVGAKCPDFELQVWDPVGEESRAISLSSLEGKRFALVFYPKDSTPGCTSQACALRDHWSELRGRLEVFGVSPDDLKSHEKFAAKQELPYPLISDPEKRLCEAFGVWVEKKMYGKSFMGVQRSTALIGPDGRIEGVIAKAKPKSHLEELLALVEQAEQEEGQ